MCSDLDSVLLAGCNCLPHCDGISSVSAACDVGDVNMRHELLIWSELPLTKGFAAVDIDFDL